MPMKYPYRRTPVYRDLVPVHPGFSFRAMNQTPQKPEWKYIDTYSLTAPIVPNYGAAIWVLLNSCVAGSGVNQRIGRSINVRSLEVRFATQAVTATVPNNIRMIWAIDRQANAHLPAIGPNDLLEAFAVVSPRG